MQRLQQLISQARTWPVVQSAVGGLVAAAAALGASELVAGLSSGLPSMLLAVGKLVIDYSPPALEDFAISVFGTNDKLALIVGTVVLALLIGVLLGVLATRYFMLAATGFVAFGALGAFAAIRDPLYGPVAAIFAAGVTAAVGILALRWLASRQPPPSDRESYITETTLPRRTFLYRGGGLLALAIGFAAAGRALAQRGKAVILSREEVVLPRPSEFVAPPSPEKAIDVPDLDPLVTPNEDFYRIDTALSFPRVDPDSWRLNVTGMVDRPYELTFDDLLGMQTVERYVTLSCVSNAVGGDLVGNAKWLGVPLRTILNRAGVQEGATQIVGRSVDDFTVGFRTEIAFDGRNALVAVGMNDEPLPFDHGFPARLVVPGLYGYVSATKWLSEIELTTWDGFNAYWIPRGWAKRAPVKTQSRIDLPRHLASFDPGPQQAAGFAWAPTRGIDKVECQINDGPWEEARLGEALTKDAWRRWVYDFNAVSGNHAIRVRATDGNGDTQTSKIHEARPDGATGYHTVSFGVR